MKIDSKELDFISDIPTDGYNVKGNLKEILIYEGEVEGIWKKIVGIYKIPRNEILNLDGLLGKKGLNADEYLMKKEWAEEIYNIFILYFERGLIMNSRVCD